MMTSSVLSSSQHVCVCPFHPEIASRHFASQRVKNTTHGPSSMASLGLVFVNECHVCSRCREVICRVLLALTEEVNRAVIGG